MDIELVLENIKLRGTLDDTAAGRDYGSLLPLTLTDFHVTEKINDLPRRLFAEGAPAGTAASAGDITNYPPWATSPCCTATSATPTARSAGLPRSRSSRCARRSRRRHHRQHRRGRVTGGAPVRRTHQTNEWRIL
jgi:hypothetical protein